MRKFSSFFILSVVLSFLIPGALHAQKAEKEKQITLSSVIVDQEGNPVTNATIYGNEGSRIAETDTDGTFTILVSKDSPLLIEADGYGRQLVEINDNTLPGNITLEKQPYLLTDNDVVNIPFGTLKKRQLTGAVTVLDTKELLKYDANQDVYAAMNGRVPGLFDNIECIWHGRPHFWLLTGSPDLLRHSIWRKLNKSLF